MEHKEPSLYSTGVNPQKSRFAERFLVPGSVLDVGCGNGLYGVELEHRNHTVLQLDLLDRRAADAQHLPFRQMDVQRLDLPDQSFDNVLAYDIMEHLDDDQLFLREVRRVLRSRLLLSVPNLDDAVLRQLHVTYVHHVDKTHRREYSPKQLTDLLISQGFSVLTIEPQVNRLIPYFSYALATHNRLSRYAARIISWQCLLLEKMRLFENSCVADWFCVAE